MRGNDPPRRRRRRRLRRRRSHRVAIKMIHAIADSISREVDVIVAPTSPRKSHDSPLLENSWIPTSRPSAAAGLYSRENLRRLKPSFSATRDRCAGYPRPICALERSPRLVRYPPYSISRLCDVLYSAICCRICCNGGGNSPRTLIDFLLISFFTLRVGAYLPPLSLGDGTMSSFSDKLLNIYKSVRFKPRCTGIVVSSVQETRKFAKI